MRFWITLKDHFRNRILKSHLKRCVLLLIFFLNFRVKILNLIGFKTQKWKKRKNVNERIYLNYVFSYIRCCLIEILSFLDWFFILVVWLATTTKSMYACVTINYGFLRWSIHRTKWTSSISGPNHQSTRTYETRKFFFLSFFF